MTNITIISKEGHNVLQQVNSNQISLTENSVVVVKIQKEDVQSLVRNGNSMIVTLKNGETITIENYYNDKNSADNSIVFEDKNGAFILPGETTAEGVVVNYNPLESVEPLLYHDGAVPILPWVAAGLGAGVVAAVASGSDNSSNNKDTTPPNKPVINPIEVDKKTPITGTGEPDGKVTVTYPDGSTATATVGKDGNWSVPNPGNLDDGDKVTAVVTDPAGNTSPPTIVVVEDTIPPTNPVINPVEAGSTAPITGTGEPGAKVTVTYPDGTTATATVNPDKTWEVPGKNLTDGDKVTAVVTDPAGNTSPPTTAIVEDTVAPVAPVINPVEAGSTAPITGTGEPGSKVTVTYPDGTTATATVNPDKTWEVPGKNLTDGDKVTAVVTDPAGNTSPPTTAIVEDTVAPVAPVINPVEAGSTAPITGTGEPGAKVTVTYPDGTTATATVNPDKTWEVPGKNLTDGDKVTAVATDPAGNTSPPTTAIVEDTIAPVAPVINPVEAGSTAPITGTGEPGATVTVTYPNTGTVTTTVGSDGKWSVANPGDLKNDDVIKAIQTDPAGNPSLPGTATVDTLAPVAPVVNPVNESTINAPITGTGEPGATVTVTYPNTGTVTTTVGSDGKWSVANPGDLKNDDVIKAIQTDPAGNPSLPGTATVDTLAPVAPVVNPVNESTINAPITGTGEPGATVTVTYPNTGTVTTTVGSDGKWSVANPGDLKNDDVIKAIQTDPAGNPSLPGTATVDTLAPVAPVVNPVNESTINAPITGTGEPGATVTVTYPNTGTVTTTVGSDGKWSVANPGDLKNDDVIKAIQTDPAGNPSLPGTATVDTLAPVAPVVNPVNESTINAPITGTGEPGATVTVTYPNTGTVTTTVGSDGKWSVANPGDLKNDDVIKAIQTDPAGNPSLLGTATVDTLAPVAPVVNPVNESTINAPITGTGEPGATVTVTYPNTGTVTTTVGSDGKWSVANPGDLKNDDVIKAIQTDPAGNPSLPGTATVDTLAPVAPVVNPVNESTINAPITGTGEPGATVTVTYPNTGTVTTTVGSDGKWSVANPGDLKNDDVIKAIQTDPAGNPSLPGTATVDTLAPVAPVVNPVNESTINAPITGTGEPGATVTVTYPNTGTVTTTVGSDGKWSVANPGDLKNDDVIKAIQTDPAGNPSLPGTATVDTLAPVAPVVNPVNESTINAPITGTGEPGATVTVTYPNTGTVTTTVGSDGKWSVANPGDLKNDDVIKAIQTDPAGNPSLPGTATVDTLAPVAPVVNPVNESTINAPITGTGEPGATVTVTYPNTGTVTTTVGSDGKWSVANPGDLKNDDVIKAIQTDPAGNPSLLGTATVDTLAPVAPVVNPVNESTINAPITGTGEPGATVTVTYPNTGTVTTTVGSDGKWSVANPGDLKNDDVIKAIQTDPAGNPSLPGTATVDTLAPVAPVVNPVNESTINAPITGTGEPGATVTVTYPNTGTVTTTVGSDGKWSVANPGDLKNDDVIKAIQTDPAGNPSLPGTATVDTLAPVAPVVNPVNESTINAPITGTGEPGATVTVTYPNTGTVTTTVGSDGKWSVANPGDLKNDDVIKAIQTDPAGNPSLPGTATVDTLAPVAPVVNPVNESTINAPITGTGEPGATVTVTYPNTGTVTTTVGSDGKWSVANPGDLKNDDVIKAIQTDPAGNPSLPGTATVDTLAPVAPVVNPVNESTINAPITGTGEPGATVTVTYPNTGTVTTTVGSDGKWSVANPGDLKNDDVIKAIQTDPAGNPSLPGTATVDTLAPVAPVVNPVNESTINAPITGTGEPGATVTVTYPNTGTVTTTVGSDGKWSVANPGDLKNDDVIKAIQTDPAGNPSLPGTATVDTLAPVAPVVNPVNESTINAPITGTGEPGATVTVTYPNTGTVTTTVGSDGKWSVANPGDLKNDDVIKAIQTDPAGNPSLPGTATVDTLAPVVNPVNESTINAPITGTGEPGATVTVTYPNTGTVTTTVGSDGKWSVANPGDLKNDDVIKAIQTDPAGNPSLPGTATVDTLALEPTLALASDTGVSATDGITSDGIVNVGNIESGATWKYSTDGGTTWTAGTGTNFTLPAGTYPAGQVLVQQTDAAGNVSTNGSLPATTVDKTVVVPVITINDTGISDTDNITYDQNITVTNLESGATWRYSLDGGTTWQVGTGNTFKAATNTTYTPGQIKIEQTDVAGNIATGENAPTIVIDRTLTLPTLSLAQDTGSSNTDNISSDGTVTATNFDPDTVKWWYSLDAGVTWIAGGPITSNTASFVIPEGNYPAGQIRTLVENTAGIQGESAYSGAVVIDQTKPNVSITLAQDTGTSSTDGITSNGSVTVGGLESGSTWKYSTDGGTTWTAGTGTNFTLPAGTYPAGQVLVQQTDAAGNVSTNGSLPATTVDTSAAAPTLALAQDTGTSSTDGITSNGTVNVGGLESGSTWKYSTDGGTTWTAGTGTSFTLPAGSYAAGKVVVQQTDAAGNVSTNGSLAATTVDTTTPTVDIDPISGPGPITGTSDLIGGTVTVTFPDNTTTTALVGADGKWTVANPGNLATGNTVTANITDTAGNVGTTVETVPNLSVATPTIALAQDTGVSATDGITSNATVDVGGLVSGATWKYSTDGGTTWTAGTGTSFNLPAGTYPAGQVLVQQTDSFGNISSNGSLPATTVDTSTTAPTLALTQDTGVSGTDGITSNGTVTVGGLESGSTWKYSTDGGTTWTAGTGTNFTLPAGTYPAGQVLVQQTDAAGNVSTNGSLPATTVDTSAAAPTLALAQDTGVSGTDGITSNGSVTVGGLESGSTWKYSTDGGTTWTAGTGTSFTLPAGSYAAGKVVVQQTDAAGNVSTNGSLAATTVDTTTPTVDIDPISGPGPITGTSDLIGGTVTVTFPDNTTTTALVGADGKWTVANPGNLATGNTVTANITDTAGNVGTTVETVPNLSVATPTIALAQDTGVSATDGITSNATVDVGGLVSGATWKYSTDGGTTWTAGTGTSFNLPVGTYPAGQVLVQQTDSFGNISSNGSLPATTVDTSAAAPTIALAQDTGVSATDGITSNGTVNVGGLESGATWKYSTDGGTTWTAGTGTSFTLPAGTYPAGQVLVQQTDAAGNVSTNGSLPATTVDTSAAAPTLALAQDTGTSSTDGITSNGTVNVGGLESGSTWKYSTDGGTTWTAGTGTSFTLPAGSYAAGKVVVQQTDAAGNVSTNGSLAATTVDTSAAAPTLALAQDTGTSSTDGITSNGTVNVGGLESGATWKYSTDGGTTWTAGTGTSFTLPAGSYAAGKVLVQQTDAAGNVSTNGSLPATTVDTSAAAPTLALAQDTGTSSTDGITSNGTVNVGGLESGATWKYSTDGGTTWTAGTGTSFTLPAGSYAASKVLVQQTDAAGNVSTNGSLPATTVDTSAAAPTLALAQDTGTSSTDGITSNGTVNVGGLESGATWKYSTDGGTTWTAGTGTSFTLPAGSYAASKVLVQQTDAAGNVSTNGSLPATTVDTSAAAPTLGLTQDTGTSSTDGISSNGSVTVGGLESGSTWKYSTDGGTTWTAGTGTSFTLPAGSYAAGKVLVQQTDAAGNVSTNGSLPATTVDTSAAAPTLALAQDTGTSSTDGITSNGTVNVGGLESGATWKYSTDGGTTWTAGTGTSFILPAGAYPAGQVQVQQTDVAGNISSKGSLSSAVVVDTITPPLTLALAQDTGMSATDGITSNGIVNVGNIESGATWKYSTDGGTTWQAGTGTNFTLPAGSYAAGQVAVQQTDVAGNLSSNTSLPATTVDTTVAVPGITINDTGISNTDNITYDRVITVTNLEPGATWRYSVDGGTTWQVGTGNKFNVAINATYTPGQIKVEQTDVAGNVATGQNAPTIVVDRTLTMPTLALEKDTGSGNNDNVSSDGRFIATNFDPDTVKWWYSIDGGATWTAGGSITSNTSSFVVPEGNYPAGQIRTLIENTAGIQGEAAYSGAVVIDQTAPMVLLDSVNTTSPISGSAEANTTVTVTLPSGSIQYVPVDGTGHWSLANPGLAVGQQVSVVATDQAGNVSPTASQTVNNSPVVTAVPPSPTPSTTVNGTSGDDHFTGSANPVKYFGAAGNDIVDYKLLTGTFAINYTSSNIGTIDKKISGAVTTDSFDSVEHILLDQSSSATITSSAINNVLLATGGHDTFNLSLASNSSDTIYTTLLNADATGGNASEVVNGFTIGNVGTIAEADVLDIHELLSSYTGTPAVYTDSTGALKLDPSSGDLASYVNVKYDGVNTIVQVDRDGSGTGYGMTTLITLNNTNTTLEELLKNHQIIV